MRSKRILGVLLFEGFELLDVFGPLEMFGLAADHFEILLISVDRSTTEDRSAWISIELRCSNLEL